MQKNTQTSKKKPLAKRFAPLIVLTTVFALFFAFDLHHWISFEKIKAHQDQILGYVEDNPILSALIFFSLYIISVAASLPIASLLTILGGYLFGIYFGTLYVLGGATTGATIIFLAARSAFGASLRSRAQGWVTRMQKGFQENAISYLLFLRLVPVFPFFVVNVVPALLGVPLRLYIMTTFIGIVPGSIVYIGLGRSLGEILAAGRTPDMGLIFRWDVLLPILGLAFLSLIPVAYRAIKSSKTRRHTNK